jgi:hypothetical protein
MMFNAQPSLRLGLLLTIAVFLSCKPAPPQPAKPAAAAGPQVRATVVTIRTTVHPEKKSYDHTLVIAGNRARNTSERDTWRMFDTKANTVTFVDDVAKTIRTEPMSSIIEQRDTLNAAALPPHTPRATFERSSERQRLHGANAEKVTIASGAYKRELWLAEHPSIPRGLFAMMHASETRSSPLAPMMRDIDEALAATRGFPLLDRSTVPLDGSELVVESAVIAIAERDVPESLLVIPKEYKDVTDGATEPRLGEGARRKD